MKASEIRAKWLAFFESKGHAIEPSAPLVPHNDPSLLWINAGMAPLKAYFDGRVAPDNPRIANSQKCIRTNDIENVGKTRRHHTFFEMLGNFSIGDYFKEEAIVWAWEFLTDPQWIGFDPERLHVTVYPDDTEAFDYWNKKVGLPEERIVKLEDNFWDIGEGPCGPCTEIFYDRGDQYGDLSDPECYAGGENERFLEVWNLVFSQFNHNKDGSRTPLPNKNIDTGAGLERFASILQNVDSNFDTDLFQPIIKRTCDLAGVTYGADAAQDVALKVIADHIRTVVFSVGDGVLPSNEGRGYVIRRLLRRAVRYGKTLGVDRPFLYELTAVVGEVMGVYYSEVVDKQEFIARIIRMEEERFHETLSDGLAMLGELAREAAAVGKTEIGGASAFKLYDTYGFPLDLTEDYALEQGLTVDRAGFDAAMEEQRARARAARQDGGSMKVQGGPLAELAVKSTFVGYNELVTEAKIAAIIHEDQIVDIVGEGAHCLVVLDRTPFYAESGGQVSDRGALSGEGGVRAAVEDVSKAPQGQHVHQVTVQAGSLRTGDRVRAEVLRGAREDIVRNHTATHLLHKALKEVLGEHVNQAGSLVEAERLRFDFSHFGSVTAEELETIERKVNEQIWIGTPVAIESKPIAEAKAMGAMALFGEKYGDVVRVVQVGDYSIELCGGCHVGNTAQIGLFRLLGESGIGSGVRRIEAVTGRHAYAHMDAQLQTLRAAAELLKTSVGEVPRRIEGLGAQLRELARDNESLQAKLSRIEAGELSGAAKEVGGVTLLARQVDAGGMDALRGMADELKAKLESAIIVLGAVQEGKVNLIVSVSPDLVKRGFHAGKLIKELAARCGGGGGGRPDMAQAGGKQPEKLAEALNLAEELVQSHQNVI
ncbi:alanine--tRNA ligase [Paenibacillus sp. IB182496]|uniref:Alanine--tRNA ligase n=1 Tax=Paenibacillus sabuli TaxID=2772509 RepID=A0A927GRA9_9BACL|nr:alanine--tRNA ligase [Paenibacillus sabuli]MBD2844547.1 alanine--tRNA ligase [Paenibacillus sabuli]